MPIAKNITLNYKIHGVKNGVYIPLMFCLLPNKQKKTCIALLKTIKMAEVIPKKIILDFKITMHQSVFEIFLETGVWFIGCCFHLGQAWHLKIQNVKIPLSNAAGGRMALNVLITFNNNVFPLGI